MKKFIIYKHVFKINDPLSFTLNLPREAKILSVQMQDNAPVLWYVFNRYFEDQPKLPRTFRWVQTGEEFNDQEKFLALPNSFIGTVQFNGWVGHLFETYQQWI